MEQVGVMKVKCPVGFKGALHFIYYVLKSEICLYIYIYICVVLEIKVAVPMKMMSGCVVSYMRNL